MRISDWSSDVCSSDLLRAAADGQGGGTVAVYFIESIFEAIIKFGRLLSGDIERFSRLRFRYPAPSHAEAYQRYFRIPVAFAQPCNAIELPRVQLDAALDGGPPALHGQAEARVAPRLARHPRSRGRGPAV